MQTVFLHYAAPPLLGAFIGYLTNKVAIRMLFRPLKPWYVLGIRVPMTPGVIPSKRHELAENMGEMVGEHLLTSTDIGAALSEERFQDHLHLLVDKRVRELLAKDLGPISAVVPKRFRVYVKVGIKTLKYQMRQGVQQFIRSQRFAETAAAVLEEQLNEFGKRDLESLFSLQDREAVYKKVDQLLQHIFTGPQAVDKLAVFIEQSLARAAVQGKTLADYLPDELLEVIAGTIESQAPQVLEQITVLLAEPAVRDKIVHAIKNGVDNFLDTLGPMGAMARGFVDMDTLDETIRTYLVDKEDDFNTWLQGEGGRDRVAGMLSGQVKAFFATTVADLLYRFGQDHLHAFCRSSAQGMLTVLNSEEVLHSLSSTIRKHCEAGVDQGRKSLAELARAVFPENTGEDLRATFTHELLTMLRGNTVAAMLDTMVNSMVDQIAARPIGVLQNLMPVKVRSGITNYIVLTANQMLLKEVPGLVDSLNIREIVTAKVDSLDLLRLEGLLLSIMEEQFKYINIFGGLLGFLIGLINLLVLL